MTSAPTADTYVPRLKQRYEAEIRQIGRAHV